MTWALWVASSESEPEVADRNEPGGGVVPSAIAEIRRSTAADAKGVVIYLAATLSIGGALILIVVLA
jgi:hypothetical protein